ncbi:MAG: hypothetical protein AB7T01_02515 [Acidithiobacillus sp.]
MPFALAGKSVTLVVDPHTGQALRVENDAGEDLGQATPLDLEANLHRPRHKPSPTTSAPENTSGSLVEIAHRQYYGKGDGR